MKVGQPAEMPKVTTPPTPASAKADQGAAATANSTASSAGVAVTVSTSVRTLSQDRPADTAEIDTEKVNAVRASIAQGTYVVNPEAIADKLLANAQEMLNRTHN